MRIPTYCDRCEIKLSEHPTHPNTHIMSWTTEELICISCKDEERKLLSHPAARNVKEGCGMSLNQLKKLVES